MKFFWNKKKPASEPKPKTKWQVLIEKYPVNSSLVYLGVTLRVRQVSDFCDLGEIGWCSGEMVCDYVTKGGEIKTLRFTDLDADRLEQCPC